MPNDLNKGILYDEKRIPRPVINGKAGKYLHRNIKHHQHKHDWSQYGIDTAHIRKHQLKGKPAAPHHYDKQQGLHPNERKHIVLHRKRTYIFSLGTDKLKHDNQIYIGSHNNNQIEKQVGYQHTACPADNRNSHTVNRAVQNAEQHQHNQQTGNAFSYIGK